MPGHLSGGRLLQSLVGEQPARDVDTRKLGDGLAAQQGGLDQCSGVIAIAPPDGGDIGDTTGVCQREPGDLGECGNAGVSGEIVDIGTGEPQDGLTPVIITL